MRLASLLLPVVVGAVVAVAPATAGAAQAPNVTTRNATAITATTAKLHGSVNPNGQATTFSFEYGPTRTYGSRTPDQSVGSGSSRRNVTTEVTGLKPNTKYHYRIVAGNATGVTSGGDQTFTTAKQPLGFILTGVPNPVTFGSAATLSGVLTGTGNANRRIVLQQRPFPYTAAFANVGNQLVTDGNGAFAFGGVAPLVTTQYRVQTVDGKPVTSPVVIEGVAVRVSSKASSTRVKRGRHVRFSGSVRPARSGVQYAIQKRTSSGGWVTVTGGVTKAGSSGDFATYSKLVTIPRGGHYRTYVRVVDGTLTSGIGRDILIHTFK